MEKGGSEKLSDTPKITWLKLVSMEPGGWAGATLQDFLLGRKVRARASQSQEENEASFTSPSLLFPSIFIVFYLFIYLLIYLFIYLFERGGAGAERGREFQADSMLSLELDTGLHPRTLRS